MENKELEDQLYIKSRTWGNSYISNTENSILLLKNYKNNEIFQIKIDKNDIDYLKKYKFRVVYENCLPFVVAREGYLHQILLQYNTRNSKCHHKNNDTLDNRRENLEIQPKHINIYIDNGEYFTITWKSSRKNTNNLKEYTIFFDKKDLEIIKPYSWCIAKTKNIIYARTSINGKCVLMHQILLDYNPSENECDHINHNGLDNRRKNLRIVTQQQNIWNQRRSKVNKSGTKGVHWIEHSSKWCAMIMIDGKNKNLGQFDKIEDAISARKDAEKYRGEFNPKSLDN